MEYASLGSLQAWIEQFPGSSVLAGEIDTEKLLSSICSLIECAVHLHDLDIAHRGLKPTNVLRAKVSRVKIADLGISKPVVTNSTIGSMTIKQLSLMESRGAVHLILVTLSFLTSLCFQL